MDSMALDKRKAFSYREKSESTNSTHNHVRKESLPDGNESMEVYMERFYMPRKNNCIRVGII